MSAAPRCDFCGRPAVDWQAQGRAGLAELELDEDGLWVCRECRTRLTGLPVGRADQDSDLDDRLEALVGQSAGAICRTLNLPDEPPYQSVIEAASAIAYDQDRYMSAWSFVTLWVDGTTVWES